MAVYEQIKLARKSVGLTQKQLADKINVAEITVRQYENHKRIPTLKTVMDMAKALNTNVYTLLGIFPYDPEIEIPEFLYEIDCETATKIFSSQLKKVKNYANQDLAALENLFSYLESIGYNLHVSNASEMKKMHVKPESKDDYYIGVQHNKYDYITFFHKKDFVKFQVAIEKAIDYELYKQFHKDSPT